MSDAAVVFDLRSMLPFTRRERIFHAWDHLSPGETLRLIADRDLKPLYYQLLAEFQDRFQWAYEQRGPEEWIVNIEKR